MTKVGVAFIFRQSSFVQRIQWMYNNYSFQSIYPALYPGTSGSSQTSQQGNGSLMQLEVFSLLKHHYSCIDLYNGPSNDESHLYISENL